MDRQSTIILFGFGLLIIGGLFWQFSDVFNRIPLEVQENEQIPNELVCMVNDAFMGIEQIPVETEGKTYYGCCQMCVGRIQNDAQVRYASDPYSGEVIDKSEAFIVLQAGSDNQVSYYKTATNFHLHTQSHTE